MSDGGDLERGPDAPAAEPPPSSPPPSVAARPPSPDATATAALPAAAALPPSPGTPSADPAPMPRADGPPVAGRLPGPGTPPVDGRRRFWITWGTVFGLLLLGFVVTVSALNSTVFSAQGFVATYLGALERQDAGTALDTPGVVDRRSAADDLLVDDALGDLDAVEFVSETDEGGGIHRVVYSYELDGTPGETAFEIEHTGNRFGVFQVWAFVTSPTAVVEITPVNDARFAANEVDVESAGGPSVPVAYDVLAPAVLELGLESELLVADAESLVVPEPGSVARVSVRPRASEEFTGLVQDELNRALDACTEQEVLQPAGCPFGEQIQNRVEGAPAWSMTAYPAVTIVPGTEPGTWRVPQTEGVAHLTVGVRSIFDGTRSVFDQDVPFTVGYLITFVPGGGIRIDAE